MFRALFEYNFLQNAVLAGVLSSVVCGIIGVIIIEKRLVMMSGGIAHTSYGGVGLGYLLGFEPILGALMFSVLAALGIVRIKRKGGARTDVIIGLFWSLGMALGVLFIAIMPGYPPDLSSYLFGNILSVTRLDVYLMAGLTVLVVATIVIYYDHWKAYLFDEEFASIIGVRTAFLDYLLLVLVAMAVVVLIRVVGIVLAIALLTAPAATAGLLTKNLKKRMIYSILLGCVYCIAGLWTSYELDIPSGASIVVISTLFFLLSYFLRSVFARKKRKELLKTNKPA